ncbi:MAG: serine/threonine-protein phosphatase [Spirochaetia bacterium]|nr:serine/threonine-protein phosphatase [Spirochaetia bacterium]
MQILELTSLAIGLTVVLFLLHTLRTRMIRGPFVAYFSLLWVFSSLFSSVRFVLKLETLIGVVQVRYSTIVYTIVFCALLLIYVCEGIEAARNFILISLLCQVLFAGAQFFIFEFRSSLPEVTADAVQLLFAPSGWRLFVSVMTATICLVLEVLLFQFAYNRLHGRFLFFALFLSLAGSMAADSLIYIGSTRPDALLKEFIPTASVKILVTTFLSVPLALYIKWFQKQGGLDLKRGTLDIFRKIEALESNLALANEELRKYAQNLEQMVVDRTKVIEEKQKQLDKELKIAADVQAGTLPENKLPGIESAARFIPCSTVSGDLYDFAEYTANRYYFFIADIQGHGVPAALVGSMCRMSLGRINLRESTPGNVLAELSASLAPVAAGHYLTAAFLTIATDDREIVYASGGHVSPLLLSKSGNFVWMEPTGSLLGMNTTSTFGQKRIRYSAGTRLVLYTDCVTEHKNAERDQFSSERFLEIMQSLLSEKPEAAATRMMEELRAFSGTFQDDLTLLIIDLP